MIVSYIIIYINFSGLKNYLILFQRLTDVKLQSIFSDLKIHDKEEIAYKHFKSDGKDPEGLEEARLRKKLIGNSNDLIILIFFLSPNLFVYSFY